MMSDVKITKRWRGVPPDGTESPSFGLPHWREKDGYTRERARAMLDEHYGDDWRLDEGTTTVSEWTPVEEQS